MTPFFGRHFAKIEKIRIWAVKDSRKIDKKVFFSGLSRNSIMLPKSTKIDFPTDIARFRAIFWPKH